MKIEPSKELGSRLKTAREVRHLTREQLAIRLGWKKGAKSRSGYAEHTLQRIESGHRGMDDGDQIILAQALHGFADMFQSVEKFDAWLSSLADETPRPAPVDAPSASPELGDDLRVLARAVAILTEHPEYRGLVGAAFEKILRDQTPD